MQKTAEAAKKANKNYAPKLANWSVIYVDKYWPTVRKHKVFASERD